MYHVSNILMLIRPALKVLRTFQGITLCLISSFKHSNNTAPIYDQVDWSRTLRTNHR